MSNFEILGLPVDEVRVFLTGAHPDPFRILGPHRVGENLVVRVFRPDASAVRVVLADGTEAEADRLDASGFYQAVLPNRGRETDYSLRLRSLDGSEWSMRDAYSFGTLMGEVDLHLFSEGNHH
ncbi:MAG TPA: hypothetical protein VF551_06055, partial [Chthoniobacterales bacterium]